MDVEQLKDEVRQIAEVASSVPEQFRDKCFELLLNNLIDSQTGSKRVSPQTKPEIDPIGSKDEDKLPPAPPAASDTSTVPMTTQLRLLMRKTGVTKEEIEKVLMYESAGDGAVHFVREPHDVAVSVGQIEWALLLALRNALLKDSLAVDPEDVRSVCQEKGFYDAKNFATNFKRGANATFFKGPMVAQGESQLLSNEGQDALGKILKRLAGESQ